MARFRRGTMFLNRYVLVEPIGQGSVTVVYQAEDTLNNRQVAVKLLEPSLADNRRAQERLRRPAEIMALLSDAGVPQVYETGVAPLGDGSALSYCVMELLTGEALDSRLARGPLSWLQAARVAATIADVLTLAHAQSIALRVIAPTGVLLTADGAKIVDFDAAMVVVPPPPAPTPASGSRRQRSAAPTPRADRGAVAIATLAAEDVYALGCLLDQMIGGTGPGAGLPAPLVELLLRCLSEPAHRPDAATLSMELWGMLTPEMAPPSFSSSASPSSSFEDGPLSVPMSLNSAPGRHSVAIAALESRSSVESRNAETYAPDSYGSDSDDTSSYAAEAYGAEAYDASPYDASPHGAEAYGAGAYGAEGYAASPYGAESYDGDLHGAPDGPDSYDGPPYRTDSFDASPYGASSYGADAYVAESYASEPPASAESAAQAGGALARAAVDRSRRDRPVEQIAYRSAVDVATAGASLFDASTAGAPALLGGRTSARGGRAGLAGAFGGRPQGAPNGGVPGGRASRVRGAGNAVAAALNGRAAAVDAAGVTAAPATSAEPDAADGGFTGSDTAGYRILAESDDARYGAFAGSDTIAGHGTGAVGAASDGRIPVPRDRERATGPQQAPVGHSGQGGRHRRRRPAWTAPTS